MLNRAQTDPRSLKELAIFSGTPLSSDPVHIIKPSFPDKSYLTGLIDTIYERRVLTNQGPLARQLEHVLEELLDVRHVVLVSSATIGLQLVIRALGLKGEIIVPSFTFIATAHSVLWEGLTPTFADIESNYFTIDPSDVESKITKKTAAIMGVHLFGNPCDIESLYEIARKRNLVLLFDAAQALGSTYQSRRIGHFGRAEVFSLHATKIVHSGEGGFITTNDSTLHKKLISMRNFGFTGYDQVESIGTNAKMSEMNAAMGLGTLPLLQENMERNQRHQERYHQLLRGIPGIVPFQVRPGCTSNYNNFSILINKEFGLTRDQLCHILWRENILARRYYFPGCHKQPPYKEINAGLKLPVTEKISNSILCLPCYPELTESLQNGIVDIIRQSHTNVNRVMAYFSKNSQSLKHPWE